MRPFIPLPTHGVQKAFVDRPLYRLENNGHVILYLNGKPICGFNINSRLITMFPMCYRPFMFQKRRIYAFAIEMGLPIEPFVSNRDVTTRRLSRHMAYLGFEPCSLTDEEKEYLIKK